MKNRQLRNTAVFGFAITAALHGFNVGILDAGFSETINNWTGVYCAWVGIFIGSFWAKPNNNCRNKP